ncbi:MAG: TrbC/VirB2 family protein [Candidatus Micrarchaeia archaeon]
MNKYGYFALIALLLAINVAFAQTNTALSTQLENIKNSLKTILPIVAIVMIVLAGVVYAAGQVMGAEMRSRASVWATSLLVGAIIGLILAASAEAIVGLFSSASLF